MFHGGFPDIGQLQIAPDGKIYGAQENSPYLAVINSPNLPGPACNFVQNGQLCSSSVQFGLPNFVSQFTGPGPAAGCTAPVAVEPATARPAARVFPNPFQDRAQLEFGQADGHSYSLMVADMMGKIVRSENDIQSPHRIDRADLPHGVYGFVLLEDGKRFADGRLLLR
jgi:hypothetical protein